MNKVEHIVTIESGPIKLNVSGVSCDELKPFFYPFYQIKTQKKSESSIDINMRECTSEFLENFKYQVSNNNNQKVILHHSNKKAHHVEGLKVIDCKKSMLFYIFLKSSVAIVDLEKLQIKIYTNNRKENEKFLRVVIRSLIQSKWEQIGGLLLHSSAVYHNGGVSLILGPKKTGKTNTLLQLVREGAKIVSFDKSILYLRNNQLSVYSWPTYFNLEPSTIDQYSELFKKNSRLNKVQEHNEGKVSLIASDVQHLGLVEKGRLLNVIMPKYMNNKEFTVQSSIDFNMLQNIINKECISLQKRNHNWHKITHENVGYVSNRLENICKYIFTKINNYIIRYGGRDGFKNINLMEVLNIEMP